MRFLQLLGVDPNRIISELSSVLNNTSFSGGNGDAAGTGEQSKGSGKALEQFGRDLTQLAAPVSYTHLDVYKRQVLLSGRCVSLRPWGKIRILDRKICTAQALGSYGGSMAHGRVR